MTAEEEMRDALDVMDQEIMNVKDISPITNYDNLCREFTKFTETFNKFCEENKENGNERMSSRKESSKHEDLESEVLRDH